MSFLAVVERTLRNVGRPAPSRQGARLRSIVRTTRAIGFATLAATGCGGARVTDAAGPDLRFDIEIRYWPGSEPDESQRFEIEAAVARWERLLGSGLPDAVVRGDAGCGPGSPAMDETVDDLIVYVRFVELDALAESGPCLVRADGGLPIVGSIWLNQAGALGEPHFPLLTPLVMHELAHVLGFGWLWPKRGLLDDASLHGGEDPHFVGAGARSSFDAIGGTGYQGKKVPVDDSRLAGTADRHWRQNPFGEELMTSTIVVGDNPLSSVTAAAMADLGYDVNMEDADPFVLPLARSARAAVAFELDEGPVPWPIRALDRAGKLVASPPPD